MSTVSVKVSFEKELLVDIDAEAAREHCSRSDILGAAARLYVSRQQRWEQAFEEGDRISEESMLREDDVALEISETRRRS